MPYDISLFTACAPWLPLAELAPAAAAAGYSGLDLACKAQRFDPSRAPAFDNNAALLDLDALELEAPRVARLLALAGLRCPVLAGYALPDDTAAALALARAAPVLGAQLVRLWTPAPAPAGRDLRVQFARLRRRWAELARIAAGEGCRFALELHDGTLASSASGALRLFEGLDPAHVGVIFDVANTVREGHEDLAMAVGLLGPFLAHVHVKDLRVQPGERWSGLASSFAPLGEGILRWPLIIAVLRAAGYDGWLAVENFTGVERGVARIASDLAWLRAQLARSAAAA
jgi:sugar phosphate isomerase/epimerase